MSAPGRTFWEIVFNGEYDDSITVHNLDDVEKVVAFGVVGGANSITVIRRSTASPPDSDVTPGG